MINKAKHNSVNNLCELCVHPFALFAVKTFNRKERKVRARRAQRLTQSRIVFG